MRVTSCNKCRLSESAGLPQPAEVSEVGPPTAKGLTSLLNNFFLDFATSAPAWRVQLSALLWSSRAAWVVYQCQGKCSGQTRLQGV